jgi:UDP-GlcNAc3NAcA epimerase
MDILTVVGARPQFIKAATVSRAIQAHNQQSNDHIQEIILHTGQHYDQNMSDVFFEEMQIPRPQYHLGIGGGSHGAMTGRMLEQIESILLDEQPDAVLVYGDTNSTLAGALAAAKLHIPVAHVEAGLRSFNMKMPEEVNRILTDQISHWLFCPTQTAVQNLQQEGFSSRSGVQILDVGDVMYDAILFYKSIAQPTSAIKTLLQNVEYKFYLATVHRAENTDNVERLNQIMGALDEIAAKTPIILPLHPRTRSKLAVNQLQNLTIIEPVGYFDMVTLLSHCQGVFTDSGGLQKEAYFCQKPCVTLRDETEWIELIHCGANILAGSNRDKILDIEASLQHKDFDFSVSLYGHGDASQKLVKNVMRTFF